MFFFRVEGGIPALTDQEARLDQLVIPEIAACKELRAEKAPAGLLVHPVLPGHLDRLRDLFPAEDGLIRDPKIRLKYDRQLYYLTNLKARPIQGY